MLDAVTHESLLVGETEFRPFILCGQREGARIYLKLRKISLYATMLTARLTVALGLLLEVLLLEARGQGRSIPVKSPQAAVFDTAQHLYISTDAGSVLRVNLATGQTDATYKVGAVAGGIDVSPDGSYLLVAVGGAVVGPNVLFVKINTASGAIEALPYIRDQYEYRGIDVAIAANNTAILATTGSFQNFKQFDLGTNTLVERGASPAPALRFTNPQLSRNADRSCILVSDGSGQGCFLYRAATDSFSGLSPSSGVRAEVNRDGTVIASAFRTATVSLDSAIDYHLKHIFTYLGGAPVFDPTRDVLYSASQFSNEIVALDPNTHAELYRFPVGGSVPPLSVNTAQGELVISPDGKYLALLTFDDVRVFQIPSGGTASSPRFEFPTDMVFDHAGKYLYVGTLGGILWRYDLATHELTKATDFGGSLFGMDIAEDDSFLLISQAQRGLKQSSYYKLSLADGFITRWNYEVVGPGSYDIKVAANGVCLVTSGSGAIRQLDLATGAVFARSDWTGTSDGSGKGMRIIRGADRSRLVFPVQNLSSRPIFHYDAASDTLSDAVRKGNGYWEQKGLALDRHSQLFAFSYEFNSGTTASGQMLQLPSYSAVGTIPNSNGGVAFSATTDTLYVVGTPINGRLLNPSQITAYDSNSLVERFRLDVGEPMPSYLQYDFDVNNLVASHDGRYLALTTPTTVRVFDLATHSATALPTPQPGFTGKGAMMNISTRVSVRTGEQVAIAGFIITGSSAYDRKHLIVRSIGPSLAGSGVRDVLQDPVLDLYDASGARIASNDNWRDTQHSAVLSTNLPPTDTREAAIVIGLVPGAYTAVLRGKNDSVGTGLVEVYDLDTAPRYTRLANISTRAYIGRGDDAVIGGVIVSTGGVRALIRGLGPTLAASHVSETLNNPTLALHGTNGEMIAANDDWQQTEAAIWNTALPPSDRAEAAIVADLQAGAFTAVLRGQDGGVGVGLIEVYYLGN